MRALTLGLTLVGLTLTVATRPAAAADCAALARMKLENTNLLSAVEVPAAGDLPAYCRVLGYVRPAINFEVRLPIDDWNGKFYEVGCGGFCGTLLSDAPGFTNAANYGLRRRYAVVSMDSGHWGTSSVDGRWALGNLDAKVDWGTRAIPETARVTKALIAAYYGRAQQKSYFAGCSTGGRMAAIEASRFPSDFDGIIMGAPALDYTGLVATFFAWETDANTGADGKPIVPTSKVPMLAAAVAHACGAEDGLIADPRQCRFEPSTLLCKGGDGADCLTQAQVTAVERMYAGPKDSHGTQLYPGGLPFGSEPNWIRWETGLGASPPFLPLFGQDFLRFMAFENDAGPSYKVSDFDFDRDPAKLAPMAKIYNAVTFDPAHPDTLAPGAGSSADLSAFQQRGGKLVIYHGWGDALVTPLLTVQYYEAIAKAAGSMSKAQDFARLFMIPGMDHCGINAANASIVDTGIDPLTALEGWVEKGQAPAVLLATKTDGKGGTVWQRPICAYPAAAKLKPGADAAKPDSWTCSGP